jgi:hypothetical protein
MEDYNPPGGRPFSRRQLFKASGGLAVGGAVAATGLTACSAPWDNGQFNPAIRNWIQTLALGVGAAVIKSVLKPGSSGEADAEWAAWEPEVDGSLGDILADGALLALADKVASRAAIGHAKTAVTLDAYTTPAATKRLHVPGNVGYGHPVPPVILVQVSRTAHGDPTTDLLLAYVTTGKQHVVMEPWAWQTLLSFVNSMTSGQSGPNLDIASAGCALSLLPSAIRPKTGESPEGTVDWVTYKSKNGWIEIARVQSSNTSATGVLTASSILDSSTGQPLSMSFPLPATS